MNKLFRWKTLYLLCAGIMSLGLFSACSEDLAEAPPQIDKQQIEPIENYIGKVNMAIEAEVVPISGNVARLQYLLGPRKLKQVVHPHSSAREIGIGGTGSTSESETPYTPEKGNGNPTPLYEEPIDNDINANDFAPFLSIGPLNSKIPGYLVFIYDDGTAAPTVFRQAVQFEVIESAKLLRGKDGQDASEGFYGGKEVVDAEGNSKNVGGYKLVGKNRVRYMGDINFPAAHTLNEAFESLNSDAHATVAPSDPDDIENEDPSFPISKKTYKKITDRGAVLRRSKWKVQAYLGYSDKSDADDKVYFGTDKGQNRKSNTTATIFEAKSEAQAELHTPCISEWTDLYIAGVPHHVGDETQYTGLNSKFKFKPQGLLLQYDVDVEMFDPTLVRSAGLISNALTFAGYYDLSDASIRNAYQQKDTQTKGVPEFKEILKPTMQEANLMLRYPKTDIAALTTETDPTKYMYPFYMPQLMDTSISAFSDNTHKITLEGTAVVSMHETNLTLGASTPLGSRRIFTFWAMPRKDKPTKPETYMFLKTGESTTADVGAQPTHVLHQTSKDFSGGKGHVHYAKGILNSTLIITEVLYRKIPSSQRPRLGAEEEDVEPADLSNVYVSLVELYNPTAYPLRLDDYFLVGLRKTGNKMQYIKMPKFENKHELTDNLSEAYLVPIRNLLKLFRLQDSHNRVGPLFRIEEYPEGQEFYTPSEGEMKGIPLSGRQDGEYTYLLPGQTLLIGGHFWHYYAREAFSDPIFWPSLLEQIKTATTAEGGYQLAGAFFHDRVLDGTHPVSPLDLRPGDGVALVRIAGGEPNYDDEPPFQKNAQRYLIDATAPIGGRPKIPFTGAFAAYKAQVDLHQNAEFFVMTRDDKVNFPFIPPYRTQRAHPSRWSDDWTVSTNKDTFTPGYRGRPNPNRTWHNISGTWARTPLAKWDTYLNARPAKH